MPYPKTAPKVKHKLLKLDELDTFQSSAEIFEKIDHAVMNSNSLRIKELSVIYSYDDGPDYPGPLSSGLLILGFAKQHLGLVKTVLGGTGNGPDGLHSATIAVKLADAHHFHKLPPKDQQNSTSFVQLMQQLRINNTVAVVARDKYRRFGLIVPMKKSHENITDSTDEHASAEDCAAYIHVGTVEDVKNFMTANDIEDIQTRKDTARTQGSSDASSSPSSGNKRLTDPLSNAEQKKRTKTGGSGTKWPIYRPDLGGFEDDDVDTTEWPFYQPDHGDFDDDETGDDDSDVQEPENSSSDSREHENSSGPSKTHVWGNHDINSGSNNDVDTWDATKKYGGDQEEAQATSWGINDIHDSGGHFGTSDETTNSSSVWGVTTWGTTDDNHNHPGNESSFGGNVEDDSDDRFHKDRGAAAADDFYSNLTRDQETTADSNLFHMRKFNNWVKSIQIQELDPHTGSARSGKNGRLHSKLRILDLACGKGGDLTKWMKLDRGMDFYFGVDVARGSLRDAAIRARQFYKEGKLEHAIFAVADLGADVLGHDQKLLTWKMEDDDTRHEPEFRMIRGGGISSSNRFDVVSIQFAIHYMMSSRERARHFFHTVSKLLEVGGNLICTTIDARIVMKKLMGLGLDLRFKDDETPNFGKAVVETGSGACKITFEPRIVKKIFTSTSTGRDLSDDMFGLEYTFTLVEGSDHAAGVGDAVNLPEWLTPIPVLEGLANEAGLELEYAQNFHEFYTQRKDVVEYQNLLRKMKALNRTGSISKDEWAISGLYAALKFRKVEESKISVNEQDEEKKKNITIEEARKSSNFPRAMLKARRSAGDDWNSMSQSAKDALTIKELQKLG